MWFSKSKNPHAAVSMRTKDAGAGLDPSVKYLLSRDA